MLACDRLELQVIEAYMFAVSIDSRLNLESGETGSSSPKSESFLPAAGRKPALDLIEPVRAPERLHRPPRLGRAEHAALDRGIHLAPQPLLHRGIVERFESSALSTPSLAATLPVTSGLEMSRSSHEIGAVERERERFASAGSRSPSQ